MKKDSLIDYLGCLALKTLSPIIRTLPLSFSLFLGRRLGDFLYYFNLKQKAVVYSNIKTALGNKLSTHKLNSLAHEFYHSFGQNLFEIFSIPNVNKEYMNKYISFEGLEYIDEAFKKGKGVILLGVHAGSWELSNIICANLGFPFSLFVRDQRHPRLNALLNLHRCRKGCKIIERKNQTRQLIEALKKNEAIGMTADQGGKTGWLVKFFGKDASMPTGAMRLSLKYDSVILPAFYTRIKGPYIKTIIEPPFQLRKTGNLKKDIHDNLQEIIHIFQNYIEKYAKDYLWSYKIWKYSKERNILILSDGKAGHLRQAQALTKIVGNCLKDRGETFHIDLVEIKFSRQAHKMPGGIPPLAGKNTFAKKALLFSSCLAGKYHCQGCLWCLKTFLDHHTYKSLTAITPNIIISCGSMIAPINYILCRENLARSIVIMRPSILSTKRFDLVIMPKHDNPPIRKNVVVTEGALNLIDEDYIQSQVTSLKSQVEIEKNLILGLLIGGNTKRFKLSVASLRELFTQIKLFLEKHDGEIMITTSRRTDAKVESLVKEEFSDYPRCKLLIIANERNLSFAIGGILGLSHIIITSAESISMISEAVNSKKYVIVFNAYGLGPRHERFLEIFAKNKYIYVCEYDGLSCALENTWLNKPPINTTKDNFLVREAIKRIL